MENTVVNDVIKRTILENGALEIKILPFSKYDMGLYEDGIRKALKGKENDNETPLIIDFSGTVSLEGLDDRALFDLFQFISFNCLRYEKLRVKWGPALLDYLVNYAYMKNLTWKISNSTISKLINLNYGEK